jgi:hypothetical protein
MRIDTFEHYLIGRDESYGSFRVCRRNNDEWFYVLENIYLYKAGEVSNCGDLLDSAAEVLRSLVEEQIRIWVNTGTKLVWDGNYARIPGHPNGMMYIMDDHMHIEFDDYCDFTEAIGPQFYLNTRKNVLNYWEKVLDGIDC